MRRLRFGGPNWGTADSTWFDDLTLPLSGLPGQYAQTIVKRGDEYEVERIRNWQSYVDRGIAELVEVHDEALLEQHGIE